MVKVTNLAFGHIDKPLYSGVSFTVGKGQKIGLVGSNGSGKTTLLKLLTGNEESDIGNIEVIGTIGWVPQEVKNDPEMEKAKHVRDYADPTHTHEDYEIIKMFAGLELDVALTLTPQSLSGGQKTKLALARALLAEPDILLLDEPTNFMDIGGKKWVMNFLAHYPNSVILISHDIELMDKAIDKVLFINTQKRIIEEYKGNYSTFLRLQKESEQLLKRQVIVQAKHIKQMEKGLSKMVRFTSAKGVRRRIQQQKRIEKLKETLPELPREVKSIKVKLPEPAHCGELPVRVIAISKAYSDLNVLDGLTFSLKRGERVVLVGPNGSGKSTLLKIIMGVIFPDSGEVIKNDAIKVGYYSQEFETFNPDERVIDAFQKATKKEEGFARAFLGRYMFMGDKVFQKIETLSGGEKTRLSIALLTAHDSNLLILDEPTTYLDVMSQRVILEALKEYKGAMLIVSHTPEFVQELLPTRAILFPEGKVVYWADELVERINEF